MDSGEAVAGPTVATILVRRIRSPQSFAKTRFFRIPMPEILIQRKFRRDVRAWAPPLPQPLPREGEESLSVTPHIFIHPLPHSGVHTGMCPTKKDTVMTFMIGGCL
jgi:hypothetical protein